MKQEFSILLFIFSVSVTIFAAVPQSPTDLEEFPQGEIIEKVISKNDPDQSYALYLPSNYSSEKTWPILYCLNAREQGVLPVKLFREAAEKYGYIVAGSNNTRSDDSTFPNLQAMKTLWSDTHARFSIDPKRAYATGFSGGARLACDIGTMNPEAVAGVIGCGGGFPVDRPPSRDTQFIFFGAIGNRDFNFREMRTLDSLLDSAGVPHQIRVFDGDHDWPPAEVCTEALEWMEIRAMKDGKKAKNQSLVEALFSTRVEKARSLETAGKTYNALVIYKGIANDFEGLREVLDSNNKVAELGGSDAVKKYLEDQKRRDASEEEYRMKFGSVFKAMRTPRDVALSLEKILLGFEIANLKRKVSELGDSEDGLATQRLLEAVFVQTSFYLPRVFLEERAYQRAIVSLSVAAEIKPENPYVWYGLARANALYGDKEKALEALRLAVQKGFTDVERMQHDIDLEAIRHKKGYEEILKRLQEKRG